MTAAVVRSLRLRPARAATVAFTLLLVAGTLVGFVAVAGASGPTITVTPHAHLRTGQKVVVGGRGFVHGASGAILECNDAPGQPATVFTVHGQTHSVGVGCGAPVDVTASRFGRLVSKVLVVATGTMGTWESGTDSSGHPATTDSEAYPCPPTAAQEAVGVACVYQFVDNRGQVAAEAVAFSSGSSTTTTSTPGSTTTVTFPGCTPVPATVTNATGTLTVDPANCLVAGSPVSITGSGFHADTLGAVVECNTSPAQPTVTNGISPKAVPVSCSSPTATIVQTGNGGALGTTTLTILTGTVGPPYPGTDSAGNDAATDAAAYPCPPTPAQTAAGVTCAIVFADSDNDQVAVPVAFNTGSS